MGRTSSTAPTQSCAARWLRKSSWRATTPSASAPAMCAGCETSTGCTAIWKAAESGLSKTELLRMIESSAHSEIALGENEDTCYTVENDEFSEKNQYEEYPVCLPRKHLPQPDGRVCDGGLGQKSWACFTVSHRISGHQPGGDRQPGLSPGTARTCGICTASVAATSPTSCAS